MQNQNTKTSFVILVTCYAHTNDKMNTYYNYWSNTCHQRQYKVETVDYTFHCITGPRQEKTKEWINAIDLFLQNQYTSSLVHQLLSVELVS